jgi:tetratricopeptide (TPR) repeat protein
MKGCFLHLCSSLIYTRAKAHFLLADNAGLKGPLFHLKMRKRQRVVLFTILVVCVSLSGYATSRNSEQFITSFICFDLDTAGKQAAAVLKKQPANASAWFVRMEVAELQGQPKSVLDSALRLCRLNAPEAVQQIASAKVLRNAANTAVFNAFLARVKTESELGNACSLNLKLALVAAASDGSGIDIDKAVRAAGLLTNWRVAGPFGHYSNADFDHHWAPEADQLVHSAYGTLKTEEFRFRDGFVTLPDYLTASGVLYGASDFEVAKPQEFSLDVSSSGPYVVFVDGKPVVVHDSRYALEGGRESVPLKLTADRHRLLMKFTADAAPFRIAVFPFAARQEGSEVSHPAPLAAYINSMRAYLREDLPAVAHAIPQTSAKLGAYLRALLYSDAEGYTREERAAWESLLPAPLATLKLAALTGDTPEKLESKPGNCAPGSLDCAHNLSAAGEHARAAEHLRKLLAVNPLDRAARLMLVEELVLDHQEQEARQQAEKLHRIAPNSERYARLALSPAEVLDSRSDRATGFTRGFTQKTEFYAAYRRDGLQVAHDTAARHFSGGPAVILLLDKVVEYGRDASLSVYTHRIIRVLNKDGINRFGEVEVPRGADLLELRTVKADGQVIEPELAQQKPTISMPALEPGDSIEEEFVEHFHAAWEAPQNAFSFTFGSFVAPLLYSRFVVVTPEKNQLEVFRPGAAEGRTPAQKTDHAGGRRIEIWEQNNIPQTAAESLLPPGEVLPTITIKLAENPPARLRDQLMEQTHIGLRVLEMINSLPAATSEHERAKALYRLITTKVRSSGAWTEYSAEDTLQNLEGSRTSTLLALFRATGIKASLLLGRKAGSLCASSSDLSCYTEPLVRLWFSDGQILDMDVESDALPFGSVLPVVERKDALLVPLTAEDENGAQRVAVLPRPVQEKSLAEGNLVLQDDGSLAAHLTIRLGVARAQQVRATLQAANSTERQAFFEQLAMRIFPGATGVSGSAAHEDDPEQPLELAVDCTVPQLVDLQNHNLDLDQLVPALGLRALYARNGARKFPLYIDSVFFESTAFHLRLPPQFKVRALPADFSARNEFGEYSVRFKANGQQIDVQREFRIPVQVVAPEKYEAFAAFARQIDDAERRRISLTR